MTETRFESIAQKEARTEGPVHELIRKRWSARAFAATPISQEVLDTLFEAASWAPSSMNEQPWRYVYAVKGTETFEALLDCLQTGNALWAKDAAVLILSLTDTRFKSLDQPNRHAMHDTGAANLLLLLEAANQNIYGHEIGGYKREETRALLDLPDYMEDVCFIALGYLDAPEKLDEPFRTREVTPRSRKKVSSFTQLLS